MDMSQSIISQAGPCPRQVRHRQVHALGKYVTDMEAQTLDKYATGLVPRHVGQRLPEDITARLFQALALLTPL